MSVVHKATLDNGLTVLLKEMHHAPVASFMIWYRVGSRHERPGLSGASHWVEHMLFKGTPRFPGNLLERQISREGGYWNAFTWLDFTAYFETMPAHKVDLCLQLEADRMVNAEMSETAVELERTVILSERQMCENDPRFLLNEALTAAAFQVHPYRHDTIGEEADLRSMTRGDLYDHYRRYYVPNNAIAVAVGDFDHHTILARIEQLFGEIPAGETGHTEYFDRRSPSSVELAPLAAASLNSHQEPPQRDERRVTIEGPGDAAYFTAAYRVPGATHPDYFPLVLLNAAFAGGSSLGLFGGGGSNRTSRLYKALVDTDLAAAAFAGLGPTIDPFLYSISAVVQPQHSLADVEAALDTELDRLVGEPITDAELARALKRAKAEFVLAGESITGQAQQLGLAETVTGDYRWYETVLEQLNIVTLDDIERVRQIYLQRHNRTVGWYEPKNDVTN
jgi:zinc protease